jgi:hypothetical protein
VGAFFLNVSLLWRGGTVFELQDFRVAFLAAGVLGFIALFANYRLPADAGQAVSGHKEKNQN